MWCGVLRREVFSFSCLFLPACFSRGISLIVVSTCLLIGCSLVAHWLRLVAHWLRLGRVRDVCGSRVERCR